MARLSAVLRSLEGGRLAFWCPGCDEMHVVWIKGAGRSGWGYNGDPEKPTFTPSIKVTGKQAIIESHRWTGGWKKGPDGRALDSCCHSFVRDGRIQFLGDCTHALAGKTVPLPAWPEGLNDEGFPA